MQLYRVWVEFVIIHRKLSKRKTWQLLTSRKYKKESNHDIVYSSTADYT